MKVNSINTVLYSHLKHQPAFGLSNNPQSSQQNTKKSAKMVKVLSYTAGTLAALASIYFMGKNCLAKSKLPKFTSAIPENLSASNMKNKTKDVIEEVIAEIVSPKEEFFNRGKDKIICHETNGNPLIIMKNYKERQAQRNYNNSGKGLFDKMRKTAEDASEII